MKRGTVVALLLLGALVAWGVWPVADASLRIEFDPEAVRAAQELLARPVTRNPKRSPNIVLILADDLGKHDLSIYDPAAVQTPSLQRLAAGGVVFEKGYVTSPVCSPSRAALLTGRYPQRFGFELLTHDRYPRNRLELFVARYFFSSHGWEARTGPPRVPRREDVER